MNPQWLGLHNPDWHNPQANGRSAICRSFYCYSCSEHDPCPCCLKAEVERLTADLWACQTLLKGSERRIADALIECERIIGEPGLRVDGRLVDPFNAASRAATAHRIEAILRGGEGE